MDNKVDFFQKKLSNTRSFTRQRRASHAWIWVLLIILLLLGGAFACRKLFWAPANLDSGDDVQERVFSLGEEVYLQGEIIEDRDFATHTHKLIDVNYGEIWLKSDSGDLLDPDSGELLHYVGYVELTGIVEKFYKEIQPIVRVKSISGTVMKIDESVDMVLDDGSEYRYMPQAGIQFLPNFFDKYLIKGDGKNGEIIIENTESNEEFVINYFRCNASDPNRNCKGLNETFANNNAQSFVTSEGDVYYKQSEVQSWFVANGDRWGMFINDVSDDVVYDLKDCIKFVNEKTLDEWIKFRAMKICQGSGEKLQNIKTSEVVLKQEGLTVNVSGDGLKKQMICQILVDFNMPLKGELQSLKLGDDVVIEENTEENNQDDNQEKSDENLNEEEEKQEVISSSNFVLDKSVTQFPLKEEGGLVYSSNRGGYSLQFPSSNISYAVSSVKENFGRSDVSCSYVINVIKYSEKENLEVSPSIRIYECLGTVSKSWAPEILIYPKGDKIFVAQLNDSSWRDFGNNLKFTALE